MKAFTFNIPISKVDEEQRIVYGYATKEELDRQGDIVDYEAAKKAFSEWPGNIREQHDSKRAVGKNVHLEFDDDNKQVLIGAKISESADGQNAMIKVREGILTGFSIGGKIYKTIRDTIKTDDGEVTANRITDFSLAEVSLVDVPACPSAQFVMVKSVNGKTEAVEEMHEIDTTPWFFKHYAIAPNQVNHNNDSSDTNNMSKKSKELVMSKSDKAEKAVYGEVERDSLGNPKDEEPKQVAPAIAVEEAPKPEEPKVEEQEAEPAEEPKVEEPEAEEVKEQPAVEDESEEKSAKPEMQKGLYTVAQLAECVENLTWIVESAEYEAMYEGDNSGVPAQLKAAVAQVGAALVAMASEEVAEAAAGDDEDLEVVELTDKPADLEKMVSEKFDATKEDLLKSLTDAIVGKVGEQLKPLEDRLVKLESQPVGTTPKKEYTVVDKVADTSVDELDKKIADMEANPSKYTAFERSALATELFKRSSRNRPILTN